MPAPESITTKSVLAGVTEIGSRPMDLNVIDGGVPPQYLLEALQATTSSQSNLYENVINNTPDNAGPAPTRNRE